MKTRQSQRDTLNRYRKAVAEGRPSPKLVEDARQAYLSLSGDQDRSNDSLKDYDHERWGPFLGVSDEGSAADAILSAALASPKIRALPANKKRSPLNIGLALDAERLGGIGEVAVGPDEYVDVWLGCVDRLLVSTNIGTRVNTRVYRGAPRVILISDSAQAIDAAKLEIADAFRKFVNTPDGNPRPLTVFVEIPRDVNMTKTKRQTALTKLNAFVTSGQAAGMKKAPVGQRLGLAVSVRKGFDGKAEALDAIELASSTKIEVVLVDGVKRKEAHAAVSLAGLLEYFAPGIVGPLLRAAGKKGVELRPYNLPDSDTIARSIWTGLATARAMGANLGKYGCFPLTLAETTQVVGHVQRWFSDWSAAPVFFVDQGLLSDTGVYVGNDLPKGLELWLDTVAAQGVEIVLIDTIDKPTGRGILRKNSKDKMGHLGLKQIARIEAYAKNLGVRVLWAGGLGMRETFEMGKLGVFGIYVTSAAATTVAIGSDVYRRDPGLPAVKEPTREGVLRAKTLLEAGFLTAKLTGDASVGLARLAEDVLKSLESPEHRALDASEKALAAGCIDGWKTYWSAL